jgi:hypothetical protein
LCPVNCPTDGAAGSGRRIDPAIVLRAERAGRTSSRRKLVPGRRNEVQVPKVLRTQRKKQEPTCTFSDREVCIGTCAQKRSHPVGKLEAHAVQEVCQRVYQQA